MDWVSNIALLMKILKPSINLMSESSGAHCNTYWSWSEWEECLWAETDAAYCANMTDRDQGLDVQWDILMGMRCKKRQWKYTTSNHTTEQRGKDEWLNCGEIALKLNGAILSRVNRVDPLLAAQPRRPNTLHEFTHFFITADLFPANNTSILIVGSFSVCWELGELLNSQAVTGTNKVIRHFTRHSLRSRSTTAQPTTY